MRRLAYGCSLLCLLGLVSGCSSEDDDVPEADEYFWDCDNAPPAMKMAKIFATDETFRAIVDKESAGAARTDATRAATVVAPGPGSTLSVSTPPEFSINVPGPVSAIRQKGEPGADQFRPATRQRRRTLWKRFTGWLAPVGTAQAHCSTDIDGTNVLMRMMRDGEKRPVYTALLSVTSFTPTAELWKRKMSGRQGQTLRVNLMNALLVSGRVMDGPFISTQTVTYSLND